jgi:hypothetical protein
LARPRQLLPDSDSLRLPRVRVFVYSQIYRIAKMIVYQTILFFGARVQIPSLAPIFPFRKPFLETGLISVNLQ